METDNIRLNIQEVLNEVGAKSITDEKDMYIVKYKDCTVYINYSFDTVPMPVIIFNIWRSTKTLQIVNLDILNDLNNKTALGTHSIHNNVYYFRHTMWLTENIEITADAIMEIISMAHSEAMSGYTRLRTSSALVDQK